MTNEETKLPDKLYIEKKVGSNGYQCTDYYNYREQIAYAPENLTRADERDCVIGEILDSNNAWDLPHTLAKLLEATDILMSKRDYDGDGWEQITQAQMRGVELLAKLNSLKENK